jgi:hypothetical protein
MSAAGEAVIEAAVLRKLNPVPAKNRVAIVIP